MARLRVPEPDGDATAVKAERLRVHADKQERWFPDRAVWLRCLADGYAAGAITPTEDLWRPPAPPSAAWTRTNREALAWLAEHGQPAGPPEAFLAGSGSGGA